jgi:hypothetical protein
MRNYFVKLVSDTGSLWRFKVGKLARFAERFRKQSGSTSTTTTGLWHCEDYFASPVTSSSERDGR